MAAMLCVWICLCLHTFGAAFDGNLVNRKMDYSHVLCYSFCDCQRPPWYALSNFQSVARAMLCIRALLTVQTGLTDTQSNLRELTQPVTKLFQTDVLACVIILYVLAVYNSISMKKSLSEHCIFILIWVKCNCEIMLRSCPNCVHQLILEERTKGDYL